MEEPLIRHTGKDTVEGAVDYKGIPAIRSETGKWKSAVFIIGLEIAERFSYYEIHSNLITYLTGPLQQSTVTAAVMVKTWSRVASLLPLLGAFVADAYLGRYRTVLFSSLLYVLGLGLLTLSAVLPPFSPANCYPSSNTIYSHPPQFQIIFFFCSLYLVALAQGGLKPCVKAFGGDQFDGTDRKKSKSFGGDQFDGIDQGESSGDQFDRTDPEESKSSFFNWRYFGMRGVVVCTHLILNCIQDNLSWGLRFGIPCVCMVVAHVVFLLGTRTYRYSSGHPSASVASTANEEEEGASSILLCGCSQFRFLYKALPTTSEDGKIGLPVEEVKALLRLVPIWATCLIYAIVHSQTPTFFTKQGATLDIKIGSNFQIPPGSRQTFINLSVVLFIPLLYVYVIIPIARALTKKHSGITILQRIGVGIVFSIITMVVAAIVEKKRLQTVIDSKIVEVPGATVPMSIWWLVPQYFSFGIADAFTKVGLQEFFYDQVPHRLRSVGLGLYLSIFGVGSFLSGFLVSAIEKVISEFGKESWFSDNLNKGHLDYFYWLLVGLSLIGLFGYLYCAKSFVYKGPIEFEPSSPGESECII